MPTLIAPAPTGKVYPKLAADSYTARCYQMIDLGCHQEEFDGVKKDSLTRKIWLGFEFPTEKEVFDEAKGLEPYTMGKEYTFSMGPKATLRKDLTNWRGKSWTEEEAKLFDVSNLLGAPGQVSVTDYTKQTGEPGVKITTIGRVPKGLVCDPQINATQVLSLSPDEFDRAVFDRLPKFLQDKIKVSPEYVKLINPHPATTPQAPPVNDAHDLGQFTPEDEGSDLPF